jgi:hypothetical protein
MSESDDLKRVQEGLTASLQRMEGDLKTLIRHTFGRNMEFVFLVYDRGLISSTGELPIAYQTFGFGTKEEALRIAADSLRQAVDPTVQKLH